jgi:integrase
LTGVMRMNKRHSTPGGTEESKTRNRNHQGGVYYHPGRNKPWEARIRVPPDGKQKSWYFAENKEKDAWAKLRKVGNAIDEGRTLPDERMTLAKFAPGWLARKQEKKELAPKTKQRYREIVRLHILPALGRKRIALLKMDDVEDFYTAKRAAGMPENTLHHVHTVLHSLLDSAVRHGYAPGNVSEYAENKPTLDLEAGKDNYFTRQDALGFLEAAAKDRWAALYLLDLTTGMRLGEILGLRWQDVDMERRLVAIQQSLSYGHEVEGDRMHFIFGKTKTKRSERPVPLHPEVVEALREHRRKQLEDRLRLGELWDTSYDLVFCNGNGRPIQATHFTKREFYRLLEDAKLPRITFHGLRRTIATHLKAMGVDTKDIAALMGHVLTTKTTETIYIQMLPETQAALTQKIGELFWSKKETNDGQIVGQGD